RARPSSSSSSRSFSPPQSRGPPAPSHPDEEAMRAVRVHTYDGPGALKVDEVEEPKPGAGEVLIDVKAAGVNFPDVLLTRGKYQFKPPPPFSPGGEAAGVVSAVGAGVKDFAVGDRVATTVIYGAFAERIVVPEMAT